MLCFQETVTLLQRVVLRDGVKIDRADVVQLLAQTAHERLDPAPIKDGVRLVDLRGVNLLERGKIRVEVLQVDLILGRNLRVQVLLAQTQLCFADFLARAAVVPSGEFLALMPHGAVQLFTGSDGVCVFLLPYLDLGFTFFQSGACDLDFVGQHPGFTLEASDAGTVLLQFASPAFDERGKLGAAGIHRLALAAQSLVPLLFGRDAQPDFVEGFVKGEFRLARGLDFGGEIVALRLMGVERGGVLLHARLKCLHLFDGCLATARGFLVFTTQVVRLGGDFAQFAFQQTDLALERGSLNLGRLETGADFAHGGGGIAQPRRSRLLPFRGGGDFSLACGDFTFQRLDLRLPLEEPLPGILGGLGTRLP